MLAACAPASALPVPAASSMARRVGSAGLARGGHEGRAVARRRARPGGGARCRPRALRRVDHRARGRIRDTFGA
eukprot:1679214-Pleurochrysis_carterae.AAC.1